MAGYDIARLLQNAECLEILPKKRNADGINVDKQQFPTLLTNRRINQL